jgi:hypothetical protein
MAPTLQAAQAIAVSRATSQTRIWLPAETTCPPGSTATLKEPV